MKDRIGSVIRTHYPATRELGMQITAENAWTARDEGVPVIVPKFMQEIVEEISRLGRTSPHVNQASGVSVRMSIANYETLVSSAERRGVTTGETVSVARPSDLLHLEASSRGKLELTMSDEPGQEDRLIERLIDEAIKNVFDLHELNPKQYRNIVEYFEGGKSLDVGDSISADELLQRVQVFRGLKPQLQQMAEAFEPELAKGAAAEGFQASLAEFLLAVLHSHNRLNRTRKTRSATYGS